MDINAILLAAASISGMGLVFGLGLGYAGKKFEVEEDPRLSEIRQALPGANCGGCGFAGCDAFAAAVLNGEAKVDACSVNNAASTQIIADIMGIKVEIKEKHVSYVKCNGGLAHSQFRYDYYGMDDCKAAMCLAGGGSKACVYGCLGCGSCKKACVFDAIDMKDGIAVIDKEKCTACGVCVGKCPKNLIELKPYRSDVSVCCNSEDSGKIVRSLCSVGCIGCKLCEKACEFDAVHVEGNIAKVDYSKCTLCNACVKKCPTHAITGILDAGVSEEKN